DSPRIDFETRVDWQEKHTLLKAMFPLNIHTHFARFETQFGYTERANNENTLYEKAKFEVCNHKWTDLSENRYGVSLLNDCKYGISVHGNTLGLSLHRGGCSPDERGDFGVHSFTYSLLPHIGSFGSDTVREGYKLNYAPIISVGGSRLTKPLFTTDAANVIIETVKAAEDGNGYIIRLYETECSETAVKIKAGFDFKKVTETNMLEEPLRELKAEEKTVTLRLKPFEIKTLRFVL
ncbi:MAG: glycoside hydrolase family 38 C-terminal domain-containing protein, partial [Acutalibacteraceae bacterium]